MNRFHIVDYVVFVALLLISLGIGVFQAFTGGKQRTTFEYLMGNRQLKLAPVALSICVTMISGKNEDTIIVKDVGQCPLTQCL